jgi:ElaB/YqjD/DUF883 family membrane-anchored ribosome-binding protein
LGKDQGTSRLKPGGRSRDRSWAGLAAIPKAPDFERVDWTRAFQLVEDATENRLRRHWRLDYTEQSKEVLKEQAGQVFSAAADIAGKAQEAAAAKSSEVWEGAKEKMREVQGVVGGSVADTTSKLKSSGEALLNDIRAKQHDVRDEIQEVATAAMDKVRDDDTRNALLLGVAGVAIATALGIACQKRISETLTD